MRAAHAEQGRRIVNHREPRRIPGFARCDETDAELFTGRQLGSRILFAADASRARRAAAPRQVRQPLQRGARAAEMIDQRTKGARPDIVGADQPQPVDALFVGQVRCTWRSSVHAAPAAAWINLKEWERGVFSRSFRDPPSGAGPESILPIVVTDSGFARF